jgi:hypothetical protein
MRMTEPVFEQITLDVDQGVATLTLQSAGQA